MIFDLNSKYAGFMKHFTSQSQRHFYPFEFKNINKNDTFAFAAIQTSKSVLEIRKLWNKYETALKHKRVIQPIILWHQPSNPNKICNLQKFHAFRTNFSKKKLKIPLNIYWKYSWFYSLWLCHREQQRKKPIKTNRIVKWKKSLQIFVFRFFFRIFRLDWIISIL